MPTQERYCIDEVNGVECNMTRILRVSRILKFISRALQTSDITAKCETQGNIFVVLHQATVQCFVFACIKIKLAWYIKNDHDSMIEKKIQLFFLSEISVSLG